MWQKIKTTEEITNNSKQQLQKQTNKVKKHLLPGFRMQCIHWMLNNHLTFMSTKLNSSSFSRNLFPQDLTTYLCWRQPHGSSTLPKTLLPSLMCFFVSHPIYDWFKKKKKTSCLFANTGKYRIWLFLITVTGASLPPCSYRIACISFCLNTAMRMNC